MNGNWTLAIRNTLAMLGIGLLAACGGGGGGSGGTGSTNTSVINSAGGTVGLSDGTTAVFHAGALADGTRVTVKSMAPPAPVTGQEVQPLSSVIEIDIPSGAIRLPPPAGSVVTVEFPLTKPPVVQAATRRSIQAVAGIAGVLGSIVQITVDQAGKLATYYGQLTSTAAGKATISIATSYLCDTSQVVCGSVKATIAALNAINCTQQATTLYQVDFSNGTPAFSTNLNRNGKPPLILVHGWQELGIIAMMCDKPYSTTWAAFLQQYALDPAIRDKFQVFSLAYSSSNDIDVVGGDFAQLIKNTFGQDPVYIVAHSMGGLVARSALVNHQATSINGIVTLASPHHGTPIASQEGVDLFSGTPLHFIVDYAVGGPGIMDLGWDNFDNHLQPPYHDQRSTSANPIVGNPFLDALNQNDTFHNRYVVFAATTQDMISSVVQSLQYDNDEVVPKVSGLFYQGAGTPDATVKQQKTYNGLSHTAIVSDTTVLADARAALLSFLASPTTCPSGQVIQNGQCVTPSQPTGKLPDSGVTASQCYAAGSNALVSCASAEAIALNDQQDGMLSSNPMSYSLVGGYDKTECVKDDVTGLIWEGKTADGGARDGGKTYTNYDDPTQPQKWNGSTYVNPTQAEIDAAANAKGYVDYVNSLALCGYTDWRLPTADELQGIVDYGIAYPGPTIRSDWFPNTPSYSWYWSSSPYVGFSYYAWYVFFGSGGVYDSGRGDAGRVRLVRASQ